MGHSYEDSKKLATKIITILAIITIGEVGLALLAKGYISDSIHFPIAVTGGIMIILSLIKAYLIVYEFMHMKYEVPGLVKSVLLPTLLLVWAVIAFFMEGDYWKNSRNNIKYNKKAEVEQEDVKQEGRLLEEKTYQIN